jgi:hypothetical protein
MEAKMLSVAKDYSVRPYGRFCADGEFSGERFRHEFLAPALKEGAVIVDLDGTLGYGSSFLEEAFGGLVRLEHFSADELNRKLQVRSEKRPTYARRAWTYIKEARPES